MQIRPFRPDDEPGVLTLLLDVFGQWPEPGQGDARSFFQWKHRESPFGPSPMSVALDDGAIVGFHALMPWRLRCRTADEDGTLQVFRGADIAVDERHRGQGIAAKLFATSGAQTPSDTAFRFGNPNGMSAPMLRKLGRHELALSPSFVRIRRPARVALAQARQAPGAPEAPEVDAPTAGAALADPVLAGWLEQLAPPPDRYCTARTADYLRWRYGARPGYWALRCDDGGEPAGLAIFRMVRSGRLWVQVICELAVREDGGAVRELLRRTLAAAPGADYATCRPLGDAPGAAGLLRNGFVRSTRSHVVSVTRLAQDVDPNPSEPGNWALSCGDLELL